MNRLYAFETTPTITGASADHRLAVRPRAVPDMAAALKAAIFDQNAPASAAPELTRAMVDDLTDAGPNALVIAGDHQPPFVHAAALAINSRLGALGNTVVLIEPPDAMPVDGDLADFCAVALAGDISSAIVLGANPLHTASADLDFRKAFAILREVIHWGLCDDETAAVAHWHVPAAHELESWSDIRAHDGTVSIVQPLIAPLYRGITAHEFLAALGGDFASDAMALVHATWADRLDDDAWRKALRDGVVPDSSSPPITIPPVGDIADFETAAPANNTVEILFVADPWLGDGRNANSAWLQELPRPLTKLVWGNAALISPRMAQRLGVENGQVVAIARSGKSLDAPVWILPGQPDNVVTLSTGFGRRRGGAVSQLSGGYDAFQLRTADAPWIADGATITVKDSTARVLTTQHHQAMEGRAIVRHATLDEFSANPDFVREHVPPPPTESVYPEWRYDEEAWGMAIDQTACIGCMACVSACQSENNIATVGPDECAVGHEMHWLRVDRYYEGPVDAPDTYFQPVPCMHCEKAPCEVVCPVNATVHTHDGLNAQIYNRCVGTRYCSQNCPYKVRRFNFLEYQEFDKAQAGPQQAVHNPDVSVRSRGVMEKCTYCVQRISEKRIGAQIDGRAIEDGEVVTACQQACPTQAISFGNLNDKQAKVVAEKAAPHNYALLEELNTRPRTTYLGRLTNPKTSGERGDG